MVFTRLKTDLKIKLPVNKPNPADQHLSANHIHASSFSYIPFFSFPKQNPVHLVNPVCYFRRDKGTQHNRKKGVHCTL